MVRVISGSVVGAVAVIGTASSLGCIAPSIDLEGRPCPCIEGWVCDAATQTCLEASTITIDGTQGTGDEGVATESTSAGIQPRFEVIEFAADWSTPESIHWTWTIVGEPADFHAFEVWVATSTEALDDETAAVVFDGSVNPELRRFALDDSQDMEPVVGTITDGLVPSTDYFARMYVLDTAGGRAASPNVAVRSTTAAPTEEAVLFADMALGGFTLPACMLASEVAPADGTARHYEARIGCTLAPNGRGELVPTSTCEPSTEPECYENLRLGDLPVPPLNINAGEFPGAFVEASVAVVTADGLSPQAAWADLSVEVGDRGWTGFRAITFRADGEYRRYQIPLSALGLDARTFDGVLTGFRVGSTWPAEALIRLDEVRVRW